MIVKRFEMSDLDGFEPGEIEREALGNAGLEALATANDWKTRAVTIRDGGGSLGFVSIVWREDAALVGFVLSDRLRASPVLMVKACRGGIETLRAQGVRRILASVVEPQSGRFLEFLGFREFNGAYIHDRI